MDGGIRPPSLARHCATVRATSARQPVCKSLNFSVCFTRIERRPQKRGMGIPPLSAGSHATGRNIFCNILSVTPASAASPGPNSEKIASKWHGHPAREAREIPRRCNDNGEAQFHRHRSTRRSCMPKRGLPTCDPLAVLIRHVPIAASVLPFTPRPPRLG